MTNTVLIAAAVEWLRYERRCECVCTERTPVGFGNERPDIFAVDKSRNCVEIEIKQSVGDFRADAKKRKWNHQRWMPQNAPRLFYYLVPNGLVAKVTPPDGAGLLTVSLGNPSRHTGLPLIQVVRPAKTNTFAKRLSLIQVRRMVMHQTGTLQRLLTRLALSDLERPHSQSDDPAREETPAIRTTGSASFAGTSD